MVKILKYECNSLTLAENVIKIDFLRDRAIFLKMNIYFCLVSLSGSNDVRKLEKCFQKKYLMILRDINLNVSIWGPSRAPQA